MQKMRQNIAKPAHREALDAKVFTLRMAVWLE
jgi:hypothetical protein